MVHKNATHQSRERNHQQSVLRDHDLLVQRNKWTHLQPLIWPNSTSTPSLHWCPTNPSLTMHGMPHTRLLWWHALLWRHYAAHSCHRGSSRMGLTRPWYETLVTRQLGLHLLLLAGKEHKANVQAKETLSHPADTHWKNYWGTGYQCGRALTSYWEIQNHTFNITPTGKLLRKRKDVIPNCFFQHFSLYYIMNLILKFKVQSNAALVHLT